MSEVILKVKGYKCERCEHVWMPRMRNNDKPVICPKCKSPYWDKPRINRTKKGAKK